jgi:hypothetical protein
MNLRLAAVITLGFITLFSGAVHADPREDVLDAMGKCSAITDGTARLSCYDGIAPQLRQVLHVPPPAMSTPPTKEEEKSWFGFNFDNLFGEGPAQQTTPQQFGAESTPKIQEKVDSATEELDSISAGVTEYSFTYDKKFIVFLDNGQIWRQLQGDSDLAHFQRIPTDNKVVIDRGLIGSYNLRINGSEKTFKVMRIK